MASCFVYSILSFQLLHLLPGLCISTRWRSSLLHIPLDLHAPEKASFLGGLYLPFSLRKVFVCELISAVLRTLQYVLTCALCLSGALWWKMLSVPELEVLSSSVPPGTTVQPHGIEARPFQTREKSKRPQLSCNACRSRKVKVCVMFCYMSTGSANVVPSVTVCSHARHVLCTR